MTSWRLDDVVSRALYVTRAPDLFYHLGAPELIAVFLTQGPCVACLGSAEHIPSFNLYNAANYSEEGQTMRSISQGQGKQAWPAHVGL